MKNSNGIPTKVLGRLSLYRRLLSNLQANGTQNVYSHQLAELTGGSAAQVRRDFMTIGYNGSPSRGYNVEDLQRSIGEFLDAPRGQNVMLVGIGNLGRALLAYFTNRRPKLSIVAAFDRDPYKTGRVIHGCRCYPINEMPQVAAELNIRVGVLTVPAAEAQRVAETMVGAGVRGILNFAPAPIKVPPGICVEDLDVTMALEKVAFFANQNSERMQQVN